MPSQERKKRREEKANGTIKDRKPNWQANEIACLLDFIRANREVLLSSFTNEITNKLKNDLWRQVSHTISAKFGVAERSVGDCREKFSALKTAGTKARQHRQGTGGGSPKPEPEWMDHVDAILGEQTALKTGINVEDTETFLLRNSEVRRISPVSCDTLIKHADETVIYNYCIPESSGASVVFEVPNMKEKLEPASREVLNSTLKDMSAIEVEVLPDDSTEGDGVRDDSQVMTVAEMWIANGTASSCAAKRASDSGKQTDAAKKAVEVLPDDPPEGDRVRDDSQEMWIANGTASSCAAKMASGSGKQTGTAKKAEGGLQKKKMLRSRAKKRTSTEEEDALWDEFLESEIAKNKVTVQYYEKKIAYLDMLMKIQAN